jgi:hypothetical protein
LWPERILGLDGTPAKGLPWRHRASIRLRDGSRGPACDIGERLQPKENTMAAHPRHSKGIRNRSLETSAAEEAFAHEYARLEVQLGHSRVGGRSRRMVFVRPMDLRYPGEDCDRQGELLSPPA